MRSTSTLLFFIISWYIPVVQAYPSKQYTLNKSSTKIVIIHGNITKLNNVDAIVNAANEQLQHAGGVAQCIARAAGNQLQTHCNQMPRWSGSKAICPTGKAIATPAFNLEAQGIRAIIHTVGPQIPSGIVPTTVHEQLLYNAYFNSLMCARDAGLRSIAFPALSTAIFGYTIALATPVALRATVDFLTNNPMVFDKVIFVLFSKSDYKQYKQVFDKALID